MLLEEFDCREVCVRHGRANVAQWLNWRCGIGGIAAREKLRVARAQAALPLISQSFRQGRASCTKVRAMTRVATPETEADLLNVAWHGTVTDVERLVRKYRRVAHIEHASAQRSSNSQCYQVAVHIDEAALRVSLGPGAIQCARGRTEARGSVQCGGSAAMPCSSGSSKTSTASRLASDANPRDLSGPESCA